MNVDDASKLMDGRAAAKLCGVGKSLWYSLTASGRTPEPVRLGGRVLWRKEDLEKWIAAGCPNRQKRKTMEKRL